MSISLRGYLHHVICFQRAQKARLPTKYCIPEAFRQSVLLDAFASLAHVTLARESLRNAGVSNLPEPQRITVGTLNLTDM